MRFKVLYILAIIGLISLNTYAQRGARIGYIDTEFILQNVPDYNDASAQLETKLGKWKSEIEKRLTNVETKKKSLENEKVLLTRELYEERLEDITFEESEILDYQQKRFGPAGDMVFQRTQIIQPVQDQIYAAVKEIAENKKYDFIFDKNADFLMLYSAERFDISDQVLRIITRASGREQVKNKKERQALEDEDIIPIGENEEKEDRAKALEEKKAQRDADLEQRRLDREKVIEEQRRIRNETREAKQKEAKERRQRVADSKNKKNNITPVGQEKNTLKVTDSTTTKTNNSDKAKSAVKTDTTKAITPKKEEKTTKQKVLEARDTRQKELEKRKKESSEKREKIREERLEQLRKNDSIRKVKANGEDN
jgi:Skp family chaperone for outer membrane proteins